MKRIFIMGWITVVALQAVAASPTNAPARIELEDQFGNPKLLTFPATNLTVLTVADKKGRQQLGGWLDPLRDRFKSRVNIQGIADCGAVPRLLRGRVRSEFRREQPYPVMMDWTGAVVQAFAPLADQANIYVIDAEGRIVKRFTGLADRTGVNELSAVLEKMLATQSPAVVEPKP